MKREAAPRCRVAVRVTPGSGRDEVVGWTRDELGLRVTARPEGGKANVAACSVLARALGVPKSRVRVVRGESSRHKLMEVDGVDEASIRRMTEAAGSPGVSGASRPLEGEDGI